MAKLEKQLQALLALLVDDPDELFVEEVRRRGGPTRRFEVDLSPEDAGKVIGRQGRTIRSLRHLLDLRGQREGRRYELEVYDS